LNSTDPPVCGAVRHFDAARGVIAAIAEVHLELLPDAQRPRRTGKRRGQRPLGNCGVGGWPVPLRAYKHR
jgi:hypothetical protein